MPALNNPQRASGGGRGSAGGGSGRSVPRSGASSKSVAKSVKVYEQLRKQVVKQGRSDASLMRAVTKRGGTKPYSKMNMGAMSPAKPKPSSNRMSSAYKKGPGKK